VSDTAARTSEATTNDGAAAKQEFIGQMRPAQRLVHGPAGPAQQRTAPPAQSKTSTPTESTVVDETSRFQAREQQQTAQRGTLQATRNAASSNAELDKGPQRSSLSGAPTVTDRPQQRIVEKSGGRDQSGSGTGEDQQDPQRQTTTRVDARVEAVQQQQVENAQRVRTQVGEAGHRRVMAEQMMLKRLESLNPERQTQTAAKHASSVIGVILKKAYGDEKMRQKDAAKFVALVLRSHGFYTYEHCTRLIDLSTSLADMVGRKDEETKERLAAGVMFKDLGEVEYLISKGTPRQRQVLEQFLAGEGLAHQGLLHDIGKIKIPKEILYKPGMLTPEEARIMQMHPVYGAEILQSIPPLAHAAPAAKHHHERYDGKGYPDRLKGDTIPFEARVIAVVDTFDAMVADRPYRKGLPLEVCRSELVKGKFKQFDPDLVDAFMEVLDEKFVRGKLSMEDYKLGPGA